MSLKSSGHIVIYPKQGDFLVDDKYLFEVAEEQNPVVALWDDVLMFSFS